MAKDLENIQTIKSNTLALLATLSDPTAPSLTYSENGRKFSWTEYQKYLQARVEWCDAQLNANEPFEVVTQAILEC